MLEMRGSYLKRNFLIVATICIIFVLYLSPNVLAQTQANINFENRSYEKFSTNLNGEWLFFPDELLQPKEFRSQLKLSDGEKIELPNKFQDNITKGTYTTTLNFSDEFIGKRVRFIVPFQSSAYQMYVNDRLVVKNGFQRSTLLDERLEMQPLRPSFIVENNVIRITFQVVGLQGVASGLSKSISIGNDSNIDRKLNSRAFMQAFLIGEILLIASISLFLYFYRMPKGAFLAFSLFSFTTAIWGLFTNNFLYAIFYDSLNWITVTRITYILPMLVTTFYLYYISKTFRDIVSKYTIIGFQLIVIAIVTIALFAPNGVYQSWFLMVNSCLIVFYLYFVVRTIMKINWREATEVITLIGIICIFASSTHDMYILNTTQNGIQLTFVTIGIFIAIQGFILSYQFALQWRKIEHLNNELIDLNETLDDKIKIRTKQLEESNSKLRSLAYIDGLTGAYNRHYFNKNLENIHMKYVETGEPIAILILDVDEFKGYNDYYGHVCGDQLLIKLVKILMENLPKHIELTRYGGEEFAIILDRRTTKEAITIAKQLREVVEKAQLQHLGRDEGIVTISVGGASLTHTQVSDANELVVKADEQLYISKSRGRNTVNFINLG